MQAAAIGALGHQVAITNNYQGLDEVEAASPGLVDDYVEMRHRPRCPAYDVRQRRFNERLAYLGSEGGGT